MAGDEAFAAEGGEDILAAEVRKLSVTANELYIVAAASDAPLPELEDVVVLGGIFEVRQFFEAAWQWEERAIAAEADAAASRTERGIETLARDRAQALVEESEQARRELQAQLDALRSSKSWLLTAPLRQATGAARRRRAR